MNPGDYKPRPATTANLQARGFVLDIQVRAFGKRWKRVHLTLTTPSAHDSCSSQYKFTTTRWHVPDVDAMDELWRELADQADRIFPSRRAL